jgi:ADP-ribosyl-[dinitrogen reductase] hydrolase
VLDFANWQRECEKNSIWGSRVAIANLSRADRIYGGLYGLLVGDALGVQYESLDASQIPEEHNIEMAPPNDFRREHAGVPIGTWSDYGAQALCLLHSLSRDTSLDLADFASQLVAWYEVGLLTPDGEVFDVGTRRRRTLNALRLGVDARNAGPMRERDNGNAALVRCLPVVLVAQSTDDVVELAMRQGLVTHGHIRSRLCCALYALTAAGILEGLTAPDAVTNAENDLRRRFAGSRHEHEMEFVLSARDALPRGSDCVVDSFWSSIHCLMTTSSYEACVRRSIKLGNDADSTSCIAGGLAGMLYGHAAIPSRWMDVLRGKELVEEPLASLLMRGPSATSALSARE